MNEKIKKYLGIDWGEKRVGLALGDGENMVAVPFKVVNNIHDIIKVIGEEGIDIVVIGESRKMSNAKVKMSDELKDFIDILREREQMGVEFIDERLTSKAADALSRDKKARAPRDAVAAMLILQSYLDKA
jgi:putative Holliday junction resolvase